MKNYYTTSRKIIGILSVLITLIALINEDISVKTVVTIFVFIITFTTGFLTTPISTQLIKTGDGIANKYLRNLFYLTIFPLTLLAAYILYILILFVYEQFTASLNTAVITVLLCIATTIIVIVPYIQTLIVLLLRRLLRDK